MNFVLRYWMIGTAIVLVALGVWALAPVLVFMALLTVGLALLSFAMIGLARTLEAWRRRRDG